MILKKVLLLISFTVLFMPGSALSGSKDKWKIDFDDESYDDYVTSVSKVPESSFEAAAAIHVLTRKDIERSGATNVVEILRMVPGLNVVNASSNQWAVTSRGFNSIFSNKLLVLIDGRTVYSPLFSGAYWQVQDTLIEDIKQIEVIRGPGATQWGANAVNGVINIITEPAVNTQGGVASVTYGNEEKGMATARYGGKFGLNSHYRVFAKHFERDEFRTLDDEPAGDEWNFDRAGFKVDYEDKEKDSFTLQGDIYNGGTELNFLLPGLPNNTEFKDFMDIYGGNLLGKWGHFFDDGGETQLQMYYDIAARDYELLGQSAKTFDFDFQYSKTFNEIHNIVAGVGYRHVNSYLNGPTFRINFDPVDRKTDLYSAFLQDKIAIVPEELFFTVGSKFEHNDFTGVEVQPSARITWLPTDNQTIWSAVSRAVRTPSIAEDNINLVVRTVNGAAYVRQQGDEQFNAEEVITYEAGYRIKPTKSILLNSAVFYNDYNDLRTLELLSSVSEGGRTFVPAIVDNHGEGKSHGFEFNASWRATRKWELKSNYSFINLDLDQKPGSTDTSLGKEEKRTPVHQYSIHSFLELPYNFEFDNSLYFVDRIVVDDENSQALRIPSYVRFDTHIGWSYNEKLELDLVGRNLFNDLHPEFSGQLWSKPSQVGRVVYGRITYKF